MRKTILQENKSYTFSDYFELSNPTKDIVAEFGYAFKHQKLTLPARATAHEALTRLRTTFYKKLPHISLTSEMARREFLISPLLFELLDYIDFEIDIEYPLNVNEKLKGNLDYLLRSSQSFIVIDAKNADLERGFTQLSIELIAMSYDSEQTGNFIYGAITTGDVWRFGMLDRQQKIILKDLDAYVIPAAIEPLFSIFLGILGSPDEQVVTK